MVFLQHRTPHVPNQTWMLPRQGSSDVQFRMKTSAQNDHCLTATSTPPKAGDILTLQPCRSPQDLRQQFFMPGTEVPAMPSPHNVGPRGLSNGSLFLILLGVAVLVYLAGGCLFMHKRRGTALGCERSVWCTIGQCMLQRSGRSCAEYELQTSLPICDRRRLWSAVDPVLLR